MTHTRFEALGAYLPSTVLSTADLLAGMTNPVQMDVERITGVVNRRVHDRRPESYEDSFSLARKAAEDCLARSRYAADELDVVISASITRFAEVDRFYVEPSFALMLAQEIGATSAIHFDVSNACAGMMTGVFVVDRMIKAGIVRNGLVVSGEQVTAVADTAAREISEKYDRQFASLSVGDSAVAVVLDEATDEADRIDYVDLMTCSDYSHLCLGMPSEKNQGMALYTDNRAMHNEDRFKLWPAMMKDFLAREGRSFEAEEFDYIIQHQIGLNATEYINAVGAREFGAEMPESLNIAEDFGNTATTSHFLVLREHLRERRIPKGSKVLMVPAASGVVTGYLSATISSLDV